MASKSFLFFIINSFPPFLFLVLIQNHGSKIILGCKIRSTRCQRNIRRVSMGNVVIGKKLNPSVLHTIAMIKDMNLPSWFLRNRSGRYNLSKKAIALTLNDGFAYVYFQLFTCSQYLLRFGEVFISNWLHVHDFFPHKNWGVNVQQCK